MHQLLRTEKEGGIFVIAEIGKNFIQSEEDKSVSEYLENAKKLVMAAKESGVDAVKFQTHEIEDEVLNIDFTSPHFTGSDRYSWVTRNMKATPLETFWQPLKRHCDEIGITFFSTPMSRKAAMKLEALGVPFWKVGSGDVQDYVLIDFLLETRKPIIISTGMVGLIELDEVVRYIKGRGGELVVLYCVSKYPCPLEHFNLATIELFREKYPQVLIGFSDHSVDSHDVDLAAVKLGARVIEKHFSFSRELWGSDHKASITPEEMSLLVSALRKKEYEYVDATSYYGDKGRELEGAQNQFRPYFNKTLVAACPIPGGTVITRDMIYAMRPRLYAPGFASNQLRSVLGKVTRRSVAPYEPFSPDILG